MKVLTQSILYFLFWSGVLFFQEAAGSDLYANPSRLTPVPSIASPISYDENTKENGLQLAIRPFQWKKITKMDQRRRWRLSMSASHPIQLYLLDPRLDVGNPPDRVKINSWAQRKWIHVEEIKDDNFFPFDNEAVYGGDLNIYLFNPSQMVAEVKIFIDTSGKPTAEERNKQPLFFMLLILQSGRHDF